MIVQHAFRKIYSYEPDDEIPNLRPSLVDRDLFSNEKNEIDKWYQIYVSIEGTLT